LVSIVVACVVLFVVLEMMRRRKLREKYDVVILPDQSPRAIIDGAGGPGVRPEYRGGIGDEGLGALRDFLGQGGTLVTLGAASDLAIDKFGVPLKNLKAGLTRDQHFAPGTILNVDVDTAHPLGYGMKGVIWWIRDMVAIALNVGDHCAAVDAVS